MMTHLFFNDKFLLESTTRVDNYYSQRSLQSIVVTVVHSHCSLQPIVVYSSLYIVHTHSM